MWHIVAHRRALSCKSARRRQPCYPVGFLGKPDERRTNFEVELELNVRCVGCDAERETEGDFLMQGESTAIAKAKNPCECGDERIRVTWSLGP